MTNHVNQPSRRAFLRDLGIASAAASLPACNVLSPTQLSDNRNQSIAGWCFLNQGPRWKIETLIAAASKLGCGALELVDPTHWPLMKRHGLVCAATKSHTFVRGMNNPKHWAECHTKLRTAIEATAAANYPNVMTFTGLLDTSKEKGGSRVDPDAGIRNCIQGYKKIVGTAERAGVTLVLEPLNTRDARPMKGHPGYLGDHVDECMEIIRSVGSPALKLLFDVYHIQVMDGDLIRRIRELGEFIAHVQVAGCPDRGPLDNNQEIFYPAVMRALADVGYNGFVGHEWIPTGDAHAQLAASVNACRI